MKRFHFLILVLIAQNKSPLLYIQNIVEEQGSFYGEANTVYLEQRTNSIPSMPFSGMVIAESKEMAIELLEAEMPSMVEKVLSH